MVPYFFSVLSDIVNLRILNISSQLLIGFLSYYTFYRSMRHEKKIILETDIYYSCSTFPIIMFFYEKIHF